MIYLVTGPPGAGKTFYAIRKMTQGLEAGKVVAGNVDLQDGWEQRLSKRNWSHYVKWWAGRRFRERAPERFFFSEDLRELSSLRLEGSRESRGLMVLDEAHNWMNARSWSADDRKEIVRFFSQHRKLGWDVLLIAQHPEMIDKQVRNLIEYNVFLRNLKKARWGGIPIFPFNLFLAVWCWHSARRVIVKREVFPLSWRRGLYDTNATSHGLVAEDEDAIWLPQPLHLRPGPETDARTRASAAGRPPRPSGEGGDQEASSGPLLPSDEASSEAGEPEAWPVEADYSAPAG